MAIDTQLELLRTWSDTEGLGDTKRSTLGLRSDMSAQAARALDAALLRRSRGLRSDRPGEGLFASHEIAPI